MNKKKVIIGVVMEVILGQHGLVLQNLVVTRFHGVSEAKI